MSDMTPAELRDRTRRFANAVSKEVRPLFGRAETRHAADQADRAAGSAAANYRAACLAQTKATFISKLSLALEEADETVFWLEKIDASEPSSQARTDLIKEAGELARILAASRRTADRNRRR
jgi:four helix bundle protein